ncbi:MAG: ZIP family metal transporter [Acidobacteria bacterium]|nr:ZIP family metal transporter [Acidobacteriota bacterium]
MSLLLIAISLAIFGSVGGIVLGAVLLVFRESVRARLVPWLVSYAVGTLLGVAFLDVLPEALVSLKPTPVFGALLGGILAFFILEKLVLWHHCHDDHCESHEAAAPLILIGHSVHNLIDGAVIAAATAVSISLGVTTALAVAAHEIPQEVGDFAILLHAGYSRTKALWLNVLSGLSAVGGVLLAYAAIDRLPHILPYFLPVAASSFLYIAMSDLIPSLHRNPVEGGAVRQVLLVGAGILTITLL